MKKRNESESLLSMVELLTDDSERNGLLVALEDIRAGRVRSLAEIEADLERE